MQDLPPPGGFGRINVDRTVPRPILRQSVLLGITVAMTLWGLEYLREFKRRLRIIKIEQTEAFVAICPFIYAEQDRKFLLHLHRMRENERELMKDHPGWIVGTLYGEKMFKTLPKEYLPPVSPEEYMLGRPISEWLNHHAIPDLYE